MVEQRTSFDHDWEVIHSTQEWGTYPPEHVIRFFARNYYSKNRKETKILDFGCGAGACTWYLAREGFDVYAFDGSKSAVNRVHERLHKERLTADIRVLDAACIDYDYNYFDAVLDNVCVYANIIENIQIMYQNIYETLKQGGKLLTVSFGTNTLGYGSGEEIEKDTYRNIPEGVLSGRGVAHFYTKNEFIQLLQNTGFRNVTVDTILYTDRGITVEQFVGYAEK